MEKFHAEIVSLRIIFNHFTLNLAEYTKLWKSIFDEDISLECDS